MGAALKRQPRFSEGTMTDLFWREKSPGWSPGFLDFPRAKCLIHVGRKFRSPRTKIGQSLQPTLIEIVFISKKLQRLCFHETMRYTVPCCGSKLVHRWSFGHRCSLVTGEVHRWSLVTGEVWPPVKFGHRWSSPVIFGHQWSLVTEEVWSPVKSWSPVNFGHRWLLVTGEVWSPAKSSVIFWPPAKSWSPVNFGRRWPLVTGEVWSLVKLPVIFWSPMKSSSLVNFGHRWGYGDLLITGEVSSDLLVIGEVSGDLIVTDEVLLTYFSWWRCWWYGRARHR